MTLETKLRKPVTASIFSPFSLHEVIEPDAMILVFFLSWVSIQLLHSPLLPSHCSWGSQGKNTEVVCHSLLQWTTFCQNSSPWPICLGWPYMAWLSFIELNKAVVHVIRLPSFLWLWFQSVCFLMHSLSAYALMGFLLPWTWGICSQLLQQSTAAAPDHGQGVSPLGR